MVLVTYLSHHDICLKQINYTTGCPKKHGNSLTNSISSFLRISIVIPNFKSHNIIMSARVYFMKTVKDCKYVSICLHKMNSGEDGQVYSVCIQQFSCFTEYNRMQSKHKQTKCKHSRRNSYRLRLSQYRYHYTKSKNYFKRRYRIRH